MTRFLAAASILPFCAWAMQAQSSSRLQTLRGTSAQNNGHADSRNFAGADQSLPASEGFQDYVRDGKLVLSLDDAIRLAFANNTDIRLDQSTMETARNSVLRSFRPFDPQFTSSFNDQRQKIPAFQELQGAPVLNTLSQTAQLDYKQTFETGTNFESTFYVNKTSTNSSFFFLNPYYFSYWQFQVSQPLLRNFGLFYNRAPIVIAQRNVLQAHAVFEGEVADILLLAINRYWDVVLQRQNLVVQKKSLDEAQQSYDRDKKALSLGALPPLDIYRPQSQVAARRVSAIQAEYELTLAEDR
ncbi:MAG TPA: TolC family protein, partial [Terriglobales bacterium]|nr:TolC family protein [Terriglobales bacterium]